MEGKQLWRQHRYNHTQKLWGGPRHRFHAGTLLWISAMTAGLIEATPPYLPAQVISEPGPHFRAQKFKFKMSAPLQPCLGLIVAMCDLVWMWPKWWWKTHTLMSKTKSLYHRKAAHSTWECWQTCCSELHQSGSENRLKQTPVWMNNPRQHDPSDRVVIMLVFVSATTVDCQIDLYASWPHKWNLQASQQPATVHLPSTFHRILFPLLFQFVGCPTGTTLPPCECVASSSDSPSINRYSTLSCALTLPDVNFIYPCCLPLVWLFLGPNWIYSSPVYFSVGCMFWD